MTDIDWREADGALRSIAARRATLDGEEARWLLVAREARVHDAFGYGSFAEYCERILGYAPHTTRERLRVAEALATLPATAEALTTGVISYSGARELTRVATADTERAWLDAATGRTLREIEDIVAGHARGDLPSDPPDPDLEPRILRLELTPEAYAMFLEARRAIEDETGDRLDDSAFVQAMCERVCRSAAGDRAPYQIALTVCARCKRATQDAGGQVLDVPANVVDRAHCDAEHLGELDAAEPAKLVSDVPRSVRRLVHRRDHKRCTVPGCRHARFLDIHHVISREQGGDHSMSNLTLLCDAHHRAAHDGRMRITGIAPDQLRFESLRTDVIGQATHALRDLGFPMAVATAAVARATSHTGPDVGIEAFLRACLRECPRPR